MTQHCGIFHPWVDNLPIASSLLEEEFRQLRSHVQLLRDAALKELRINLKPFLSQKQSLLTISQNSLHEAPVPGIALFESKD